MTTSERRHPSQTAYYLEYLPISQITHPARVAKAQDIDSQLHSPVPPHSGQCSLGKSAWHRYGKGLEEHSRRLSGPVSSSDNTRIEDSGNWGTVHWAGQPDIEEVESALTEQYCT